MRKEKWWVFWNSPSSPFLRPVRSLQTAQSRKYNLLIARRRINAGRDENGENSASPATASPSESILFILLPPPVHLHHSFLSVCTFPSRPKQVIFCYLTREGRSVLRVVHRGKRFVTKKYCFKTKENTTP